MSAMTKGQQRDHGMMVGDIAVDNPHNPTTIKIHLRHPRSISTKRESTKRQERSLVYLAIRGNKPGPLVVIS